MKNQIFCTNCFHTYENEIQATGHHITFNNVKVQCPYCRTMNNMPDGEYDFNELGDITRFVALKQLSTVELNSLKNLAETFVNQENSSIEEFEEKAIEINPQLSNFLKSIIPKKYSDWLAFLQLLIAVIALYVACRANSAPPVNTTIINNTYINNKTDTANKKSHSVGFEEAIRKKRLEALKNKKRKRD